MKNITLLLTFGIFSFISNAQSKTYEKIVQLNKQMEESFKNNDMLKVSSFYLDTAIISGGRMTTTGRDNINKYWLSLKDQGATWKLEIDAIEDYGQVVIQRGRSYLSQNSGGSQRNSNVKFILVWRKIGEDYKILYDYFSML